MTRIRRALLLATLVLTLGLAVAPVHAGPGVITIPTRCGLTATGAGETVEAAIQNALDQLRENWWITSYTVGQTLCTEAPIPGHPNQTVTLCSAKVTACGFFRPYSPFP